MSAGGVGIVCDQLLPGSQPLRQYYCRWWYFHRNRTRRRKHHSGCPGATVVAILVFFDSNDTLTENTINDAQYGIGGVTRNNVSGNTFLNVTTFTSP